MAQREIGLAVGEPPTTKGYPPSVFSMLPRLLERSGNADAKIGGGITGLYTVLVEGDDMDDPIADSVRSILDGHIVLSRNLAEKNHYPAVDVMASVSRTMINVVQPEHRQLAGALRNLIGTYRKNEDLITIGAYVKGHNSDLDEAVAKHELIENFLKQDHTDANSLEDTVNRLRAIVRGEPNV